MNFEQKRLIIIYISTKEKLDDRLTKVSGLKIFKDSWKIIAILLSSQLGWIKSVAKKDITSRMIIESNQKTKNLIQNSISFTKYNLEIS